MKNECDIPPKDPKGCSPQNAIDWSVLDGLALLQRPGAPDLRTRLITIYLKTSPGLMEGIKTAFITADAQLLKTSAHTLKSSSLSLGAIGLGSICAELENIGRANALQGAGDLLIQVVEQYTAVTTAFSDVLAR
jgi:HPt (histidine-containing phosphotransfer) domain-containing protein